MLDYRMESFLTLCKERSYSKAAKQLCITQPAITQHIQYLERYYKAKLFEYTNKQVTLTEQGKILERYAVEMNNTTKQVQEIISQSKGFPIKLRVGASPVIGELHMPYVLEKLLVCSPKLRLTYNTTNNKRLLDGLQSGYYSCVYLEGPFKKNDFEHHLLGKDEIIPVSGTPIKKISVGELLSHTLICREQDSGLRKAVEDLLYHKGLSIDGFDNHIEVSNMSVMKHLIKANAGIGFLYRAYVAKELAEGNLHQIPIDITSTQEFNFVYLKNSQFKDCYLRLYDFSMNLIDNVSEK